jgi:hypothetical protein
MKFATFLPAANRVGLLKPVFQKGRSAMSDPKKVLVMIGDKARADFSQVVEKLRKAGMKVVSAMENIGFVRGEVPPKKMESLSHIEGVENVQEEQEVHLYPPEE